MGRRSPQPDPEEPKVIPSSLDHRLIERYTYWQDDDYGPGWEAQGKQATTDINRAEWVSSIIPGKNMHAPILDIDVPAALVPSSTPGHSHLYLDVPMTWRQYKRLLKALARAGVIEKRWAKVSIQDRNTTLSVPWLTKAIRRKA